MFGVLVPIVEGAIAAGCAEGAVDGVEGYIVDRVDGSDIVRGRVAVAFEGEVQAVQTSC
jgi:hypothetical protein